MPPRSGSGDELTKLSVKQAQAALAAGDPAAALKWLQPLRAEARPKSLEGSIRYALAKEAAAATNWGLCERELAETLRLDPEPLYQRRLELVRRRQPLLDDETWQRLRTKVDPAERLPSGRLTPVVSAVWTCGAYHTWGHARAMPWSRLLRIAKNPPRDEDERTAILWATAGFLCRFILAETPLLRHVDIVIAIPPDPERYARRGMSLPDQLAQAISMQLALPWPMEALVKTASIELRGLSRAERRRAVVGSMAVRDFSMAKSRCVLLVDDVTTSGATLSEAARVLRAAGVSDVHGVTLCHAEG